MKIAAFAMVLAILVTCASAQTSPLDIPSSLCSSMFPSGGALSSTGIALGNASTYSDMMSISILIVLAMLTFLGLTYAFGTALNVESLKNFTRSEFVETIFSLGLIVVLGPTLAFAGGIISFISNVALAGMQTLSPSASTSTASTTACSSPSSTMEAVYSCLCTSYIDQGANLFIADAFSTFTTFEAEEFIRSIKISLAPDDFGVIFNPFNGIYPLKGLINAQLEGFYAMIGIMLMLTFFLYLMYAIFPLFLYLGLLLRSFPWTRTAGGSLLAIFIAFYIIFPSILYPFALYMYSTTNAYTPFSLQGAYGGLLSNLFSVSAIGSMLPSLFTGTTLVAEIYGYAQAASAAALQLIGVLIAFVISFDLVEALGDILGAPSLRSAGIFGKLIK